MKYSLSMMRQIPAIKTIKYCSNDLNERHCCSASVLVEMSWCNLERGHRGQISVLHLSKLNSNSTWSSGQLKGRAEKDNITNHDIMGEENRQSYWLPQMTGQARDKEEKEESLQLNVSH